MTPIDILKDKPDWANDAKSIFSILTSFPISEIHIFQITIYQYIEKQLTLKTDRTYKSDGYETS